MFSIYKMYSTYNDTDTVLWWSILLRVINIKRYNVM